MNLPETIHDLVTHPKAAMVALGSGALGLLASLQQIESAINQLVHVPHMPVSAVHTLQNASDVLGVVVGASLIIASTAPSILGKLDQPAPEPPHGGESVVIPFPQAAPQPQSPQLDNEQKAA